jgi:hypothetical protein
LDKDKKMFLERVIHMAKQSLMPENTSKPIPHCERYAVEDFDSYVREKMSVANIEVFENHCLQCIDCARRLMRSRKSLISEREKVQAEKGYLWTMNLLDRLDKEELESKGARFGSNLIQIILNGVKGALQVIQTSGDVLELTPIPARGPDSQIENIRPGSRDKHSLEISDINARNINNQSTVQIVQEFEQPHISIQVTLEREGPDLMRVIISVLDKDNDDFLSGVEMQLYKDSSLINKNLSDENGEVSFVLKEPLSHEIELIREGATIGHIKLVMNDPET